MEPTNTRGAALVLGILPSTLYRAVWDGRLTPPAKTPGGAFLWTDEDIGRARRLLRSGDASDICSEPEEVSRG